MSNPILRSLDAEVTEKNDRDRTIVARIQTSDIDHYNSVILTRGIDLRTYNENRILLWEHGRDSRRGTDPIGTCAWVKPHPKGDPVELRAMIRFLNDDFSRQRYEWYRDGVLKGFSVRVLPDWERCSPATRDEIKSNPALGRGFFVENGGGLGVFMYRGGKLGEVSCTALPGNASCLTLSDQDFTARATAIIGLFDSGKLWLPDEAASVYRSATLTRTTTESMGGLTGGGATVPPAGGNKVEPCGENNKAPKRYITCDDGKWTVHAEDGKPMGSYDSEDEAKKRIGEIEYFKQHDKGSEGRSAPMSTLATIPPGLRIEPDDHGNFIVYDGAKEVVSYPDRTLAERAIVAMRTSRTFSDVHETMYQVLREQKMAGEEIARYVKAELNLQLNGVV